MMNLAGCTIDTPSRSTVLRPDAAESSTTSTSPSSSRFTSSTYRMPRLALACDRDRQRELQGAIKCDRVGKPRQEEVSWSEPESRRCREGKAMPSNVSKRLHASRWGYAAPLHPPALIPSL